MSPQSAETPSFAISRDGSSIAYYDHSPERDGAPLIVIAGGPGADHRYMQVGGALKTLSQHRRVVFWDQRGSSRSAEDRPGVTISDFVDDLEAVRTAIGAATIDLLGHSFGGYLAMAYGCTHPGSLRRLVLASTNSPRLSDTPQIFDQVFPDRAPAWREARSKLPPRFPGTAMDPFHAMEFVSAEARRLYVEAVANHVYNVRVNDALRADMARLDFTPKVAALQVPTLLLHGRWDAIIAPAGSWAIHRLIAGSRISIFERSGHSPFVEQPEDFAAELRAFLAG